MAHGRRRSFIGGVIAGVTLIIVCALGLICITGVTFGPPGYPLFMEKSARESTVEWARLSMFPENAQSFTITTNGGMFTREFRVSFFGDPAEIASWVASCPGVSDPRTTKKESSDGSLVFEIPGGSGATFAQLIHHPVRGTVLIHTYWS